MSVNPHTEARRAAARRMLDHLAEDPPEPWGPVPFILVVGTFGLLTVGTLVALAVAS